LKKIVERDFSPKSLFISIYKDIKDTTIERHKEDIHQILCYESSKETGRAGLL
jgi:hypothetical protein